MKDVAYATWFGGVYQDPKNFFAQFAIIPRRLAAACTRSTVVTRRNGRRFSPIARAPSSARSSLQRFGWKVGDHVPLKAPGFMGGTAWDFNIRAIYHGTRPNDDETQFWLQHDYLVEKGPVVLEGHRRLVHGPRRRTRRGRRLSRRPSTRSSRNSASETRTQSEAAFAAAFVQQMGNIEFLIRAIGSIVFFTLLLVTGNTMAIAVRERTNELATLKAIGYTRGFVLGPRAHRVDADRGHRRHAGAVARHTPSSSRTSRRG